jgi:hypothetical protein
MNHVIYIGEQDWLVHTILAQRRSQIEKQSKPHTETLPKTGEMKK